MASLRLLGLRKSFGAVVAVDDVSLELEAGEIHAVLGENGAGKSTLLRMGAGLLAPDAGHVEAFGAPLVPHTPREAIRRGVAMVEQHFSLVEVFDAIDNIQLGVERVGPGGRLRRHEVDARVRALEEELGVTLPRGVAVEELSLGDRQRIEIVRALYRDAKVLILDEPTAVLSPGEVAALYGLLRRLARGGRAVAVVTHKLGEVQAHAQRATVLRHGRLVATRSLGQQPEEELAALTAAIMGEGEVRPAPPARIAAPRGEAPPALVVRGVRVAGALEGVSFSVGAGEIVGLAGVEGNGQRELVDVLAGVLRPDGGTVEGGPVAAVFGDRHKEGLVLDASVAENLLLGELATVSRGGLVRAERYEAEVQRRHREAGIVPPDPKLPARALSGGNQQKIVMARVVAAVERGARVVVLAHPTRGVDLRASEVIHEAIRAFQRAGCAVLVQSADLAELRALASRLLVLSHGHIAAELPPDAPDEVVGRAMLGVGVTRASQAAAAGREAREVAP